MSRLGGAGAIAQLVADVPLSKSEVVNLAKNNFNSSASFLSSYYFHSLHLHVNLFYFLLICLFLLHMLLMHVLTYDL